MKNYVRNYSQEVLGMLLEKFDIKKYEHTLREEGKEEGIELGIRALINTCNLLGVSKEQTISRLTEEFSLSPEDAQKRYLEKRKGTYKL